MYVLCIFVHTVSNKCVFVCACVRAACRSVGSESSKTWSLLKKWPKTTMTASPEAPPTPSPYPTLT